MLWYIMVNISPQLCYTVMFKHLPMLWYIMVNISPKLCYTMMLNPMLWYIMVNISPCCGIPW